MATSTIEDISENFEESMIKMKKNDDFQNEIKDYNVTIFYHEKLQTILSTVSECELWDLAPLE